MEQRLIKNLNILEHGIYFIKGEIQESRPEVTLTLNYDNSSKSKFIKENKFYLKRMVEMSGFADVFVAYWYFKDGKAFVYICSEHKKVNSWFIHYLYERIKLI